MYQQRSIIVSSIRNLPSRYVDGWIERIMKLGRSSGIISAFDTAVTKRPLHKTTSGKTTARTTIGYTTTTIVLMTSALGIGFMV
jgi:hypothetical protein